MGATAKPHRSHLAAEEPCRAAHPTSYDLMRTKVQLPTPSSAFSLTARKLPP